MTTIADTTHRIQYWSLGKSLWLLCLASLAGAGALFHEGLVKIYDTWMNTPEYSHGVLIPLITGYLIWQRQQEIQSTASSGSWLGLLVALGGMALFFVGEFSAIYALQQYAILVVLLGWTLSATGWKVFRIIAVPLLILFFTIPLPQFLYANLSAKLQLVSSEVGVAVIRLFDISVFLEGNVIDLGSYKLQVVEACNGLRYLFPLMTLGFVMAYLYQAALWKRAFVFLSTIPITVLMNSFRIGVIGVLVDRFGQGHAEGFLHDFEGWVIFMACFGVLFAEMWLLMRVTGDRRDLREVFGLEPPASTPVGVSWSPRPAPLTLILSTGALLISMLLGLSLPNRVEIEPPRKLFAEFPTSFDGWEGRTDVLEDIYIKALKFTDYALINYRDRDNNLVNFYSAYYSSQRKGESVHSPRSCLPGGGWEIQSLTQRPLEGVLVNGKPLVVNRVLISYGDQKQLVYYWFQQRGRIMTNEFVVKWNMLVDAILSNRSDGALVRLVLPLQPGGDADKLDKALTEFASKIAPVLPAYIPN